MNDNGEELSAGLWDFTPVPEPTDPAEQDAFTDEVIDRDLLGPKGAGLAPSGLRRQSEDNRREIAVPYVDDPGWCR